jgi:hypothetical protein
MLSSDWIAAIGLISSIGSFFAGKRLTKAQAQNTELDATAKAVRIWRELTEDLRKEVDKLRVEIDEITLQFEEKCRACKYKKKYKENGEG